jgi:hypothetical protein
MTLQRRKLIPVLSILTGSLLANAFLATAWLRGLDLDVVTNSIRAEYAVGIAAAAVAALLIVLQWRSSYRPVIRLPSRRCPVCDEALRPKGRYCGACGSRV